MNFSKLKLAAITCLLVSMNSLASITVKLPIQESYESIEEYKKTFIGVMNASIKKTNSNIEIKRSKILRLISKKAERGSLTVEENRFAGVLLEQYQVTDISELPSYLNIVPAGLVIALSVHESKWGLIKGVSKANNPFLEVCYKKDCGIKYSQSNDSGVYSELDVYVSLDSANRNFIERLNSDTKYQDFRNFREEVTNNEREMESLRAAKYFANYNEVKGFDQRLRDIIFNNNLHYLD